MINIDNNNNNNDSKNKYNNNNNNSLNPIVKNSLEYYDSHQQKIQNILDQIEYIKIINNTNINDEYIFFDANNKQIFKSRIEQLGMFVPQNDTWKWAWSIPFAKFQNTQISRKILEYAFTLNHSTDLLLKSTLINSKLIILNQYQIDIYLALTSMLSKKPFILRLYLIPPTILQIPDKKYNIDVGDNIYYYKQILDIPEKKNFISIYVIIIDWNI